MRDAFARALHKASQQDDRIFFIVADISPAASLDGFRRDFPTRVVDVGVSEQAMIGMAAGLAMRGYRPFTYTIANFTIYRPFEQVRVDLCYQNLPVVLVGVGGGMSYSALGGTHHTVEDLAVMSALPNMNVLVPCDPQEVEEAVLACGRLSGPVYLRLGKAGEPVLASPSAEPFRLGKLRLLQKGTRRAILGVGPILELGMEAARRHEAAGGEPVAVYSAHTFKPFDLEGLCEVLRNFQQVITLEEHGPFGGLAERVLAEAGRTQTRCRVEPFYLQDQFIHAYGTQGDLRESHGITVEALTRRLQERPS